MPSAQFVMFLLSEEWPEQFAEIQKYGTPITYKTFRSKLCEAARNDLSQIVKNFTSSELGSFIEKCECYVISHPNFPNRKAYGITYMDKAWIFV